MNISDLIKPTRKLIYTYAVLIAGLAIPLLFKFGFTIFIASTIGPEEYADYIMFRTTNVPFILTTIFLYLAWLYLIASIIVRINKRES